MKIFHSHLTWQTSLQLLSLVAGLIGTTLLFILVWPDQFWLRVVSLFLASFYVLWGGLTHTKAGSFSKRVFWEYVSIACFGLVMLWLVI